MIHHKTLALLVLVSMPLSALRAQLTNVYVDALRGSDVNGDGSTSKPYKTLTTAVTRSSAVAPAFRLRPGVYDTALGEVFPIQVPANCRVEADPATVPAGSFLARFDTALQVGATFDLTSTSSTNVTFKGLWLGGGMFLGIRATLSSSRAVHALMIEDCEISQSRAVNVTADAGTIANVTIRDSVLNGPDTPLTINSQQSSKLSLLLERSFLTQGLRAGALLHAQSGGAIALTGVNCVFWQQQRVGLSSWVENGSVQVDLNHVLFADVARLAMGQGAGAIVDTLGSARVTVGYKIANTIFHNNRADAPSYTAQSYTFQTCLVKQPNLANLGGNILGTAVFVNDQKEQWRLVAGSPGIDQGTVTSVTDDLAGQPRNNPFSPTKPDIGPYEHHALSTWNTVKAFANGSSTVRLGALGPSNTSLVMFVATGTTPVPWVPGLHVSGVIEPLLAGSTNRSGAWEQVLSLPPNLLPGGTELWLQPLFLAPPRLGPNASRLVTRVR